MVAKHSFFAKQAWVAGRWARDVRLDVAANGTWQRISEGGSSADAIHLQGAVLPGAVNAHSHAFQRAIAGLTERSSGQQDDFWSWRERMYSVALRISPEQLQAIATQLYAELLAGGYTHVCEFHYLHNDTFGKPYADPIEMSHALVRAAQTTGIGLTLLPVLYMHSDFAAQRSGGGLREDQRRFASTPDSVLRMAESVSTLQLPTVNAGLALHSLRAVDPGALQESSAMVKKYGWPIHIHIAEQTQEVKECIAHHGQRPLEWLLSHTDVDARWNLVHATHSTPEELSAVHKTGAAVVLCPSTEANLGDGVFDLPHHLRHQGIWSIGSDSHVTRRFAEELRLLEYSQRITRQQRNVAAHASAVQSTAAALLDGALRGGSSAAGIALAGLQPGQRADFVTLDPNAPALAGVPVNDVLDAWVFSSPDAGLLHPHVAGQPTPDTSSAWQAGLVQTMQSLWGQS